MASGATEGPTEGGRGLFWPHLQGGIRCVSNTVWSTSGTGDWQARFPQHNCAEWGLMLGYNCPDCLQGNNTPVAHLPGQCVDGCQASLHALSQHWTLVMHT